MSAGNCASNKKLHKKVALVLTSHGLPHRLPATVGTNVLLLPLISRTFVTSATLTSFQCFLISLSLIFVWIEMLGVFIHFMMLTIPIDRVGRDRF